MRKFWLVFKYEFRNRVFRWRFFWALLSLPLGLIVSMILMVIMVWFSLDHSPVGIVDQAGFFDTALPKIYSKIPIPGLQVQFQLYPSDSAARAALDAKEIKVYYVFPPDFRKNRQVDVFYTSKPEIGVRGQLAYLVRLQYLRSFPADRVELLANGPTVIMQSLTSTSGGGLIDSLPESTLAVARMIIPFGAVFLVFAAISTSAGYLSQAVADEKANRTIEILVTSVSPEQLMTGKIIALVSVGLTQLLFWFSGPLLLAAAAVWGGLNLDRLYPGGLGALSVLLWMVLPTMFIYAALIVMITISFGDPREGQQSAAFVLLFSISPIYLMNLFASSPNGAIPMVLSFFPLTTMTAFLMRSAFTTLPAWQIGAGWCTLLVGLVIMFWLTARVFRASMLRIGKPIFSKAMFGALVKRAWPAHLRREPVQAEH